MRSTSPRKIVQLADGEVPYDHLIVAAGSRPAYFGHDEWAAHARGLKTMEDAIAMRQQVLVAFERAERERDRAVQRRLLTFVVIGGGATGVELAGALAEISRHALAHDFRTIQPETARVILIEGGADVLATYPPALSAFARRALEQLGVAVWTGTRVTDIEAGPRAPWQRDARSRHRALVGRRRRPRRSAPRSACRSIGRAASS